MTPAQLAALALAAARVCAAVLLVSIFCLLVFQVVSRTMFDFSIFWVDELARYCYVWTAFIAAGIVFANGQHIRIEIIHSGNFPTLTRWLDRFGLALAAVLFAAIVWESYPWLLKQIRPRSSALRMPLVYFYGIVWLCYLSYAAIALSHLGKSFRGPGTKAR